MSMHLASAQCRRCGKELTSRPFEPKTDGSAPTAKKFEQCLRQCLDCGQALSNSARAPRWIFRDYRNNVPEQVRDGLEEAVGKAVKSAKSKPGQLASESSEDALTWTVIRHLELQGSLALLCYLVGRVDAVES